MCVTQFFGDQSPFQIIVAAIAIGTGLYTLYKSFLERAHIRLFSGDRLGLVLSARGGCTKFHLRGTLANHAVKTGTLHRLEAELTTASGTRHAYDWNIFFAYVPGTLNVQPASSPIPVSLPGKSTQLLLTQFELASGVPTPAWSLGRYTVTLIGWVNKANRARSPNLTTIIHFTLDAAQVQQLSSQGAGQAQVMDVFVEEWRR